MALISLSEWLDRFGDAAATQPSSPELDSLRFEVADAPSTSPDERAGMAATAGMRVCVKRGSARAGA
jgi:hypothetical protein